MAANIFYLNSDPEVCVRETPDFINKRLLFTLYPLFVGCLQALRNLSDLEVNILGKLAGELYKGQSRQYRLATNRLDSNLREHIGHSYYYNVSGAKRSWLILYYNALLGWYKEATGKEHANASIANKFKVRILENNVMNEFKENDTILNMSNFPSILPFKHRLYSGSFLWLLVKNPFALNAIPYNQLRLSSSILTNRSFLSTIDAKEWKYNKVPEWHHEYVTKRIKGRNHDAAILLPKDPYLDRIHSCISAMGGMDVTASSIETFLLGIRTEKDKRIFIHTMLSRRGYPVALPETRERGATPEHSDSLEYYRHYNGRHISDAYSSILDKYGLNDPMERIDTTVLNVTFGSNVSYLRNEEPSIKQLRVKVGQPLFNKFMVDNHKYYNGPVEINFGGNFVDIPSASSTTITTATNSFRIRNIRPVSGASGTVTAFIHPTTDLDNI